MNLVSIKADYKVKISLYKKLRREVNMLQRVENIVFLNCSILLCLTKCIFWEIWIINKLLQFIDLRLIFIFCWLQCCSSTLLKTLRVWFHWSWDQRMTISD